MKFKKIVETCIYSSDLEAMKDFYIKNLGLEFISEEKGRHVFLKAGKSMLLIFNPEDSRSIYFRDPAGNLVEFVTKCNWPVED
jgi:catechol 2,3-dioxygenase-like lactoylglutathione lyase family enzyme